MNAAERDEIIGPYRDRLDKEIERAADDLETAIRLYNAMPRVTVRDRMVSARYLKTIEGQRQFLRGFLVSRNAQSPPPLNLLIKEGSKGYAEHVKAAQAAFLHRLFRYDSLFHGIEQVEIGLWNSLIHDTAEAELFMIQNLTLADAPLTVIPETID